MAEDLKMAVNAEKILWEAVHPKVEWLSWQIVADAIRNCPIDTGELIDTIRVEIDDKKHMIVLKAGTPTKAYYAIYVELGTRHMRGRFYLNRAIRKNRGEI
jgi:hypothetical protein